MNPEDRKQDGEQEIDQIYQKIAALKSMANDVERDVNRYKRELKKIENQTSRIKTHKEDVKSKLVEKIEQELISAFRFILKIHSEEDEYEIPSETETEKELMDDFFEKVSLNDHSPLEIDKICLHADNIKVMSPTKITKVQALYHYIRLIKRNYIQWKMRQSFRRLKRFSLKSESEIESNETTHGQTGTNGLTGPTGPTGRTNDRLTSSSSGSSIGEEIPMINKKSYREDNIEIGCCAVSRKKMKKIKKNSEYKFSIVSMKHQENQIPNIFSWTKSYIPNTAVPVALASDYKTI